MTLLRNLLKTLQLPPAVYSAVYRSLPLARALLCVDCEFISVTAHACPMCGSTATLNLGAILERETGRAYETPVGEA